MNDIIIAVIIVTAISIICGVMLAVASKFMSVKADQKESELRACLPGANCGACGFSGCDGMAEAIVNNNVPASRCPVGGAAVVSAISDFMGVEEGAIEENVARVICQGTCQNAESKYDYTGLEDCHAANALAGGMNACSFGCLGLGSCKKVCPFDAISIVDGVARINTGRSTGCGTMTTPSGTATCPGTASRPART
jgi:electron transport complex protein RnfB